MTDEPDNREPPEVKPDLLSGPLSREQRSELLDTPLGGPVSRLDFMRALEWIVYANTNVMSALIKLQEHNPDGITDELRRIGENLQAMTRMGKMLAQDAYEDLTGKRLDD